MQTANFFPHHYKGLNNHPEKSHYLLPVAPLQHQGKTLSKHSERSPVIFKRLLPDIYPVTMDMN